METGACANRSASPKSLSPPLVTVVRRGICVFALLLFTSVLYAQQNAIQIENAKQGDPNWDNINLADAQPPVYTDAIEGYASLTSVNRGGQITFYVNVSTPGHHFTIKIYRMGWYGGLGARLVHTSVSLIGVQQPVCPTDPTTGLIECNWTPSDSLTLNNTSDPVSNWVSGVYIALLTDTTSTLQRYMVFVVRDDARTSDYFFQSAVTTYQAYNNWGGKSLYAFDSAGGNPATKVSFNRPYKESYGYDGSGDFITGWEYDAVRFLEREGYDVTYGTDLDAHENASLLLSHNAILIVGHSEYWSREMRNNIIAARDQGVSLGIFAGNVCYWQVRFEPSVVNPAPDRTMVGYKDSATVSGPPAQGQGQGPDPYYTACIGPPADPTSCSLVTERWRDAEVNMPENAFLGVMYEADPVDGDIVVTDASHWVFNSTGLQNNDTLPGLLGYEVDGLFNNGFTPTGIVTLAASPYTTTGSPPVSGTSHMTVYTAASGATVFASGSIQFAWGLDDYSLVLANENGRVSPAAQQLTRNLLTRFSTIAKASPSSLTFGNQWVGTPSASRTLSLLNTGTSPLTISTAVSTAGDFSVQNNTCPISPSTLAAGLSCDFDVIFLPTAAGPRKSSIVITDDATGSPQMVIVTGVGTAASLSPASLTFGGQTVGLPSTPQAITLSNVGTSPMNIWQAAFLGTNASDFSKTTTCGSTLGAGASCTFSVTFTPGAAGTRTASLMVSDDGGGSPQAVPMTGTGVAAALSPPPQTTTVTATSAAFASTSGGARAVGASSGLSPSALSFGKQKMGTSSSPQNATFTNTRKTTTRIRKINVSGSGQGDFVLTNTCGAKVVAGKSCTLQITFTPHVLGARKAVITIQDDVLGSPPQLLVEGVGVQP
jgi:hypothetical protein